MRVGRLRTVAALAAAVLAAGCTGHSRSPDAAHRTPVPTSPAASGPTRTGPVPASVPVRAPRPVPAVVPVFASAADRDAAFLSRAAELSWSPASAGPAYPATFRRNRLADARAICAAARSGSTGDALAGPRGASLPTADRNALVKLAILDYCPGNARALGLDPTQLPRRALPNRCPRADDVVIEPEEIGHAQIDRSGYSSSVRYHVTLINLTDFPVWVQPEVRWNAMRIVLYGYPTSSGPWRPRWERLSDKAAEVAQPARLLGPGASWRVETIQNGAYSWTGVDARVNPALFIPTGCT